MRKASSETIQKLLDLLIEKIEAAGGPPPFPGGPVKGLDFNVALVDATGAALGTGGNPITTTVTGGGSATSATDEAAWTAGASLFNPVGAVFNDSAAALTTGQQGTARLTPNRAFHAHLRSQSGVDLTLTNNNAAPASLTNLGALTALANAAVPTWTEGNQVLLSANLAGALRAAAEGPTAAGSAIARPPVVIGGNFSGNVKLLTLDTAGNPTANQGGTGSGGASAWFAQGPDAAGTAVAGRPFGLGVSDGTNIQLGKQITAATGTTGVGLPGFGPALWDLVGTTNFVKQAGDGSGRAMVVGAAAAGAAVAGNPVLTAGSDGANARSLSTDSGGRLWARPSSSAGAALFPDQAALADATANPTLTEIGTFPFAYNGTTWDRWRSVTSSSGTTGTGVPGVGNMLWDLVGTTNFVKQAGDGSGRAMVVGAAAAGAAVAGNPVLLGTSDGTNAQTWPCSTGTTKAPLIALCKATAAWGGDAVSDAGFDQVYNSTGTANGLGVAPGEFNGVSWDRIRNNVDVTFLASASRSSTQGPTNVTTYNARAIYVWVVCTAGTGTVTLKIDAIDPASGNASNLLTGTAVTNASTNIYKVGIGLTAAANAVDVDYLPRTIALTLTSNAVALTYSVGYSLIAA